MNAERRKEIAKARELLNEARVIIEQAAADELGEFENLSESLQDSGRGQRMQEAAETLEGIAGDVEEMDADLEAASQ